jgi:hypothetical protein
MGEENIKDTNMTKPSRRVFIGAVIIIVAYVGVVKYMLSTGTSMTKDSVAVVNDFYEKTKAGKYQEAHSLLTLREQQKITTRSLTQQWQDYEKQNGPIESWVPALSGLGRGNKVSMFPSYVDHTYDVKGTREAGQVSMRLVRENGNWRIDELSIYR